MVRFYALYQIKPHVPPFVSNLSHFLWVQILRSYSPGGIFNVLTCPRKIMINIHRWQRGLQGSLILFAPQRLRTKASVYFSESLSSVASLYSINKFHLFSINTIHATYTLSFIILINYKNIILAFLKKLNKTAKHTLYAQ